MGPPHFRASLGVLIAAIPRPDVKTRTRPDRDATHAPRWPGSGPPDQSSGTRVEAGELCLFEVEVADHHAELLVVKLTVVAQPHELVALGADHLGAQPPVERRRALVGVRSRAADAL